MIISLFTFGLSWAVYALVFYGLTLVMPQFHSAYSESTFTVAFLIGFLDAALLKAIRLFHFRVHLVVIFLLSVVVNYALIRGTSGLADTYYVTGHKAPLIAGTLLALAMMIFELAKVKFFTDSRR